MEEAPTLRFTFATTSSEYDMASDELFEIHVTVELQSDAPQPITVNVDRNILGGYALKEEGIAFIDVEAGKPTPREDTEISIVPELYDADQVKPANAWLFITLRPGEPVHQTHRLPTASDREKPAYWLRGFIMGLGTGITYRLGVSELSQGFWWDWGEKDEVLKRGESMNLKAYESSLERQGRKKLNIVVSETTEITVKRLTISELWPIGYKRNVMS